MFLTILLWVRLATLVKGDPKASFSVATTPRCRGGRYSISWIAPFYSWSLPECKARRNQVPFLSLWYDSAWDWTVVSQTISEDENT